MASETHIYAFRLYVSESNPSSASALANLKALCRELGDELCAVEVVDVHAFPERAEADRVFAVPTLIKTSPSPTTRVLGDLSDGARVIALLRPSIPQPR